MQSLTNDIEAFYSRILQYGIYWCSVMVSIALRDTRTRRWCARFQLVQVGVVIDRTPISIGRYASLIQVRWWCP